jgi:hypothetical protein
MMLTKFFTSFLLIVLVALTLRKNHNFYLNLKKGLSFLRIFISTALFGSLFFPAIAQQTAPANLNNSDTVAQLSPVDTLSLESDTISSDTVEAKPSVGDIETTILYDAKDSIKMDVVNQIFRLYGEAVIVYGQIELSAAEIEINYITKLIRAKGRTDSLGNVEGKPVFKDGGDVFYTDDMTYNFDTRKAIINGVVTEQQEANIRGEKVYKNERDELFINKAIYTTCNKPEPHFHIQANKIKMIPNKKVMVGPFHMRVKDMPIPVGFAFGMFPIPKEKSSGVVVPTYGYERRRGYFLRNGGYYFAINDYVDLETTVDLYSKGSWGLNMGSTYKKRYAFNGRFSLRYNKQVAEAEGDSTVVNDFWLNWSHSPQSKGNSRFSASVSMGSSSFNQNNPGFDLQNTLNQDFNSSVSYSTSFRNTPFSLNMSSRLQQNIQTGVYNVLLPDFSFNMNRQTPFKNIGNKDSWYSKLNFSWTMTGTNQVSNNIRFENNEGEQVDSVYDFTAANFNVLWQNAQNGIRHRIPISTSVKALKYFTLSPSFNYDEIWYFKKLDYRYDEQRDEILTDTLNTFSRVFSYSASASLNTRLYGTVYFKKGNINAIRHVMTPSVSLSYRPDFSAEQFGYYQEVQSDSLGNTQLLSRYAGFAYGAPGRGESASANFSLSNNIEMKVKAKDDSTQEFRKIKIFDNLSLSTGYNFLADSFKLSSFNFNGRTRLFKDKVDLNFGGTIDPYIYELQSADGERLRQTQRDILAWNAGQGLGQLSRFNFALSMNLNPEARDKKNQIRDELDDADLSPEEQLMLEYIENNPDLYVDFKVPWNLRVNYNFNYSRRGFDDAQITQSIQFRGDVSLTEKWKMNFSSGFDFVKGEFTQTSMGLSRDLHCWQMAFNWVPFGRYESYNLTINAKSSILQDLKVNRQRSWWDN